MEEMSQRFLTIYRENVRRYGADELLNWLTASDFFRAPASTRFHGSYPDIITQGSGRDVYYTNSCHIPVKLVKDINSTFKHQDDLQTQFTGGTVIHCYLEGAIPGEHAKQIVKSMFETYRVPYMSLSPISRYCPEHGYIKEIVDKCPICKQRLKKYQRITGYLRCIDNFNRGKAAEFKDRVQLSESQSGC